MKQNLKLLLIYNLSFAICWLSGSEANAQNIGINGTGANAHPSALLDVDDAGTNSKGLLIPRIPLTAINVATPVTSPATSLLVYNTASASTGTNAVTPGYYYWDGIKWVRFAYSASGSSANDWNTLGNAGTNPTTNFLGTTDAQDLVFRASNLEAVRINTVGNIGIGTINPGVVSNWTLPATCRLLEITGRGINNSVSSGIILMTNDNPTAILNDQCGALAFGHRNNIGNLSAAIESRLVGAGGANGFGATLNFFTKLDNALNHVERMRIDHSGYLGIGLTSPQAQLHVNHTSTVTASSIARLERVGAIGFTQFQSGATAGDWNGLVSAGDKSIIFTNDGNPGADDPTGLVIAAWSGTTNPTGFNKGLKIMENGNIGIGNALPNYRLLIEHNDSLLTRWRDNTSGTGFRIKGVNRATGSNVLLQAEGSDDIRIGAGTRENDIFIDGVSSNVGVGLTTPAAKLHVLDNQNKRTLHVEHDFTGLVNTDAAFIGGIDAGYTNTGLFVLQKDNTSFGSTGTNLINVVSNSISHMLINGVGYMGIGTTSPALKLHLHDVGQNFHALRFTAGSSQANYWDLVKRGEAYAAGENHNFVIAYNLAERVTITPTGEVGISSATPDSRLDVLGPKPTAGGGTGASNNAASQAIIADGSGGSSYQNDWPVGWGGGLATWDICGQGTFFALYNTRSDRRLKKDITDMNQSIETNFMKLRPVTYLFKKETPEVNGTQYGFIAQEVAELFPTLVTKDTNVEGATIGMNYQGLIAPTVHVVQEQQKKIEQQQLQISELLKRIEALEKR